MPGLDAFGTTLSRGDGAIPTEVFTAIANVTSLSPGGVTRETLEVTSHDSPNGYREFIGGLLDPGEVSFDINYDPAVHDVLVEDFEDTDPRNYKISYPNGAVHQFPAILTEFSREAPFDDKLSASVTMKITGKPVITPAP